MLVMRNKRIRRMNAQQKPAEQKFIQLGAKYLNDPEFVAKHRKVN